MDKQSLYGKQVQLLVQALPIVFTESCFALKGGTAINLFVRDLPRLSVDIDLVYLPSEDRADALKHIKEALSRIHDKLLGALLDLSIHKSFDDKSDALRLIVSKGDVRIKIELSPVLRGTVFEPEVCEVTEHVEDQFGYVSVPLVSLADLYGGKICAALDRQHPRDLFDVKLLMENEGVTEKIRKAMLVYMISHPRPISELIAPHFQNIRSIYEHEFIGMSRETVSLTELESTRKALVAQISRDLTADEKAFLISFKMGKPDWSLLGLLGVEQLPAVRWKLLNLNKMNPDKRNRAVEKLKQALNMGDEGIG